MESKDIFLYNTLTRQKETFKPVDDKNVRMYVCGPTVYDRAHLGNARPVVVFDTLFRLLRHKYGHNHVTYARNITDVDDKIMARAHETGESIESLTTRTTQAYHDDMGALNALPPTIEPRATGHIAEMIALNEVLIAKGHAYVAEGHVLFHVPSMKNYGQLSRRSRDELIAGARVDVAPYKKDAADFVLWKPSAPDQPGWESPWGRGRPGWHIECSAMARKHLGTTFDIHGGGLDLIFPHHENEIAQSCCAHDGAPLARVWMHNGFLTINHDKMSKSLGNFFTVNDLLQKHHGEVIRLALLSAHYRQPLDFSEEKLQECKVTLEKWYSALGNCTEIENEYADLSQRHQLQVFGPAEEALCDDLNTPQAMTELNQLAAKIFKLPLGSDERKKLSHTLRYSAQFLGLLYWTIDRPVLDALLREYAQARYNKDFAKVDQLRAEIQKLGVQIEDGPKGTYSLRPFWRSF